MLSLWRQLCHVADQEKKQDERHDGRHGDAD
jgi:hypothetical protein